MPKTKIHQFSYQKENIIVWTGKHETIGNVKYYKEVQIHNVMFRIGDFAYLFPPAAKEGDPFWVLQITSLYQKNEKNFLTGRWFHRDTDVYDGDFTKYNIDPHQLYLEENFSNDENQLISVCGKAFVHFLKDKKDFEKFKDLDHFYCLKTYNYETKSFGELSENCFLEQKNEEILKKKNYKGTIRALDLFSGCGGFSNGMEMNENIKGKLQFQKPKNF